MKWRTLSIDDIISEFTFVNKELSRQLSLSMMKAVNKVTSVHGAVWVSESS